jgi:mono/diheme cytochrome c family protein
MNRPFWKLSASFFFILAVLLFVHPSIAQDDDSAPAEPAPAPAAAASNDGIPTDADMISQGAALYKGNCQQCHAIHTKVVGPALANVWERQPVPWLINFIKYPQRVIESGDPYAVALYNEYKQFMPNHDFLSDNEILAILAYVKDETIKGPAVASTSRNVSVSGAAESGVNANLLMAVIVGLLVLLVVVLVVMIILASVLTKFLKQEKGLTEEDQEFLDQRFSLAKILKSPAFVGIAAFIFLNVVAKSTVDGLFSIGVQQGYAPEQPIAFSHKLHAGYYEIDCKYCHTSVEKSKSANIPSANICMNCHNAIKTTSPEIQKIYAAIENDEPIQWVRVHNLPDLAYFNHAQHVKVAGLECENCHGDIKEMEVVQQHSLLTMGWCIDCHRKTELNTSNNEYYDRLVQLHESSSKKPMTVENIGGLECAKCHY